MKRYLTTLLLLFSMLSPAAVDEAYYQSDRFFPILAWLSFVSAKSVSQTQEFYDGLAECGFTLAGFAIDQKELDLCAAAGLKAYYINDGITYHDWTKTDDQEALESAAPTIAAVNGHPALYGYYIKDEPNAKEFSGLAAMVRAVHKLAPGKAPYINLLPDYASAEQLGTETYEQYVEQFLDTVDIEHFSYDHYYFRQDGNHRPSYFENLAQFNRSSRKHGVPYSFCALSVTHLGYADVTEGTLAFQAYTALAYGARGLNWFSYKAGDYHWGWYGAPLDVFGKRDPVIWNAMRRVNCSVKNLAQLINHLTWQRVYHFGTLSAGCELPPPESLIADIQDQEMKHPFLAAEFIHDQTGDSYVLIVNKDFESARKCLITWRGEEPSEIVAASPWIEGETIRWGGENTWFAPGYGLFLKVTK